MSTMDIKDLSLSYGPVNILREVSLPHLRGGQLIGILGANGAGKSTLLRGLAGLGDYAGAVVVDETELNDFSFQERVERIAYLPQTLPQPSTLVAYEAVVSACRAVWSHASLDKIEEAVESVFELLNIRHLAFQPLRKMSGGQRQMVGLAQIIVRRPKVMLLDEPTSALDLRWQLGVFDVVRTVLNETEGLCLMALHDLNLAIRHCDQLAVFSDGRLLSFGAPQEALSTEVLAEAYNVRGRIEMCSEGKPFVVTDGIAN